MAKIAKTHEGKKRSRSFTFGPRPFWPPVLAFPFKRSPSPREESAGCEGSPGVEADGSPSGLGLRVMASRSDFLPLARFSSFGLCVVGSSVRGRPRGRLEKLGVSWKATGVRMGPSDNRHLFLSHFEVSAHSLVPAHRIKTGNVFVR